MRLKKDSKYGYHVHDFKDKKGNIIKSEFIEGNYIYFLSHSGELLESIKIPNIEKLYKEIMSDSVKDF